MSIFYDGQPGPEVREQLNALYAAFTGSAYPPTAGMFAPGTLSAPSVRGTADPSTGVNFPGGGVIELVSEGERQALVTQYGLFDPESNPYISSTNAVGFIGGGAIFEPTDNANGNAIKYSDGTLICSHQITCSRSSDTELRATWNFPIFFSGNSRISLQPTEFGGLSTYKSKSITTYGQSGGGVGVLIVVHDGIVASGDMVVLDAIAVGKWK